MKRKHAKNCRPGSSAWAALLALDPRPVSESPLAGERNPNAKLSDADVRRLRKLYAAARELGCTHTAAAMGMAACFRVHTRTVGKYVWRERRARSEK